MAAPTGNGRISAEALLHAVRQPRGWPRRFVDFVFTDEGQRIVEEVGFVSLWETTPADSG